MIARKEWFARRKYGGWGVTPKTWQSWAYIACVILIPMIWMVLAGDDTRMLFAFIGVWAFFLGLDIIPVMIGLKKDERETQVEALSERNAAWFMSIVLVFSVVYDMMSVAIEKGASIPPGLDGLSFLMSHTNGFVLLALIGGAMVKSISNYILDRE